MIWTEVETKYTKEIADKMKNSNYLQGITVTINSDGEMDYPERDINLAYRDVTKQPIHEGEWD